MSEEHDPFTSSGSTEGVDESSLHKGGGKAVDKPGFYHVQVEAVEFEAKEKSLPSIKITMVVAEGTEKDQVTRKIYHRIYPRAWEDPKKKEGKHVPVEQDVFKGFVAFLYGFGVLTDAAFGKTDLILSKADWQRLESCQAIVEVSLVKGRPYTDRNGKEQPGRDEHRIQWNNQVYRFTDEKVVDVPRDHDICCDVVYRTGDAAADDLDEL